MGIGEIFDKVGSAIEDGVENVVEGAGQIIDDGLDVVGDAAEHVGLEKIGNALDDLGDNIASATGGDVEEEELGQAEDPKELILGEPSEIGSAAETLTKMAEAIESTGQALQKIDAAEWTGKGADAFNAVYDKQPKLWFDGADAMAAAAEALKAWQNEVKAAQDKAQTAIDRWKAADAEERRQKTWWNGLTGEQQQANPLIDTWTAIRNEAREILRGARVQRDNGASIAVGAIETATERAPKEPPFSERWIANISDLKGVFDHAALNFTAGFLTAVTGMVQLVRQVNPTDIYNITHPAEYAKGLSDLGTGLVVAVADPGAAVDAILKEARANPFEFAGSLAPDLILTAATGGGGSVKTAISALKRGADAGRRVSGNGADPNPTPTRAPETPSPTRDADPPGQTAPREGAGLPQNDRGSSPSDVRPVEASPQREAPTQRTEDIGGYSNAPENPEPRQAEPAPRTQQDEPVPTAENPGTTRDPEPTTEAAPTHTPEHTPDPEPPTSRPEPRPEAAGTTNPDTSAPTQRAEPSPTHTDQSPTQRTEPASTHQTDNTPTSRSEPTPTQQTDNTPTSRTDQQDDSPAQRSDPTSTDSPTQRAEPTPTQRSEPESTQHNPSSPTATSDIPHTRTDGHPDSGAPSRTEPDGRSTARNDADHPSSSPSSPDTATTRPPQTADTSPASTNPNTTTASATQTSNPATSSPLWQPGPATHADAGQSPRNPDATPIRPHSTPPSPTHTPPSPPRPDTTSARRPPDSSPTPRPTVDTPRAGVSPDPSARLNGNSPVTASRPDTPRAHPTQSAHPSSPTGLPDRGPSRPVDDGTNPTRTPDPDRDAPTDRTPGGDPNTSTDRTPDPHRAPQTDHTPDRDVPTDRHPDHDTPTDRDPGTPTDRTPDRDTPADRSPDRGPDNGNDRDVPTDRTPDRDPETSKDRDPDSDTPTAKDRADADSDAHDQARKSGAEHDRTPEQKTCSTDPVDISTGEFLLPETDLELPGVLPLVLRRSHHSNYRFGRWFGTSWSSTLDARVVVSDDGVTFLGDEGIMLAYPHAEVGEPVRPLTDGQSWTLTRTDAGGYRVWDQRRELIWHFAPEAHLDNLDVELGNFAVSAITDRHHNRIRFHYDADGVPVEVSHSGGYRVRVESAHGRVTGLVLLTDGEHGLPVREFGYTTGLLTSVTNADSATTRYTYDAEHRMTSWTDSNGNQMVNTYDDAGRVVHQRGTADILNCVFAYVDFPGGAGRLTAVTDSLGAVTTHGFDRELQLRDRVTPDGAHFHTDYNAERKPLTVTGPDPDTTTTYRYNGAGDPVEIVRPDGVSLAYDYVWRHRPSTITTADGSVHRREWSDNGDLTAAVDPAGSRTEFTYHPSGALASVLVDGARTTIDTDAAGLPIILIDPLGATTRIDRDAAGRPIRTVDPTGAVTTYEWSPAGNLLRRTDPDGRTESWAYDGEGNIVAHTDPAGGVTSYSYRAFDLLRSRRDPDGSLTRYEWDTERRLTAVHNPLGQTWTYEYDHAGRLVAETDYSAARTTYTWDSAGRIATVTPATGISRHHRYDILGRCTEVATDDGDWIRYTHDPAGRVLTASTGNGDKHHHVIEYTYSSTGLLEAEQIDNRPPMRFGYDQHARRITRTSPTGAETTWHHDLTGRVDRLGVGGHDVSFEYNLAGHLTRWRTGEVAVDRLVSARGQLVGQEVIGFPARLVSLSLDRAARPAPQHLRRDEFLYRADGYLSSHAVSRPNIPVTHHDYTLDVRGRVTTVARNNHPTERYGYDPLGNLTGTAREYRDNLLVRDSDTEYHHDPAGRLIRKTTGARTWHYRYISFDQLTDVYTPDRQWWHYTYDALGRRTTKQHLATDGTVLDRTDYTWDDTHLIEATTATSTTRWEYHPGTHLSLTQSVDDAATSEFRAIITDLVGTPTELIDPTTAATTATATTTLWGKTTWQGTTTTPLRFPGQFHDPESDLHYNLHRVYDPHTARYLTRDPLGLTAAPNPHTYPHNPLTWRDPLGLIPDSCDSDSSDDTPDPNTVNPPDPTPTRPTADTGQPRTTPDTVPDPNADAGTTRPGSSDTGPPTTNTPRGRQEPFGDRRDAVRDRITPPRRVVDGPELDPTNPDHANTRGTLRPDDYPLPVPDGPPTRIVNGTTDSGTRYTDTIYGDPPNHTVVRDYPPRSVEYKTRTGGTFRALRHEQHVIHPPDADGNVRSFSRSQVGDNVVRTESLNGRHVSTQGVIRHDFSSSDKVKRKGDSPESTAATNTGHEGVDPTGTGLQYDGGHASSYRTTLDRGLANLFAQERWFNQKEFKALEAGIADWPSSGPGRETRIGFYTDPPGAVTPDRVTGRVRMQDANGETFRQFPIDFSNHGGNTFKRMDYGIDRKTFNSYSKDRDQEDQ
ncbi:putative T7SS-secreted protein [Nocardia ignorata]|uniref:putative T7SS-secreted protein n=1 Tax=Nocardia ignorata TaxID=145285 RepID=UPI0036308BA4